MCCFSGPVHDVSATRIFARHLGGDRQALVYSMNVEVAEELAMVLPLPVAAGAGEDALSFVDLSAYPTFFGDLADAFPVRRSGSRGGQMAAVRAMPTLAVHDVGDFVASYVPTPRDFDRLDRRRVRSHAVLSNG